MNDYLKTRELYHSGIKGQKWGIRRYQNEDGTLTEEGRERYALNSSGTKGAVVGAVAGVGVGVLSTFVKNRNRTFVSTGKALVDKTSGRSYKSVVAESVFKTAGLAFLGGYLGRKIARTKTKESIKQEKQLRSDLDNLQNDLDKNFVTGKKGA